MVIRWIGYLLLLIGALLLQIYSDFYLAAFVLAAVVFAPILSLLVSLPAILGCRVRLWAEPGEARRGDDAAWILAVDNRKKLPLSRIVLRLEASNRMFGGRLRERRTISGASSERRLHLRADTTRCGMLQCRVESVWVWDAMGLFRFRRRCNPSAQLPVLPPAREARLPEESQSSGGCLRPRPGGGPGEDYDIREYRPGDPVRMIHWKLSSKRDDPVIREVLEEEKLVPTLGFDHFGPPEALEDVISQVEALCLDFLSRGQAVQVGWKHPESGQVRLFTVAGRRDWSRCALAILSDPAPADGAGFSLPLPKGWHRIAPEGREP